MPLAVRVVGIATLTLATVFVVWNYERWVNPTEYWRERAFDVVVEAKALRGDIKSDTVTAAQIEERMLAWHEIAYDLWETLDSRYGNSTTNPEAKHIYSSGLIITLEGESVQVLAREHDIPVRRVFGFNPEIGRGAEGRTAGE